MRAKPCVGSDSEETPCNDEPCNMEWSSWGNCSAICGRGNRRRYTLCATEEDGPQSDCKDLGLDSQAFEHIEPCNTWNKDPNVCPRYVLNVICIFEYLMRTFISVLASGTNAWNSLAAWTSQPARIL